MKLATLNPIAALLKQLMFGMQLKMAEGELGGIEDDGLDDVLDDSIDDMADLPSFAVPPTGLYDLTVTTSGKKINEMPAVEFQFVVRNLVELEDKETPENDIPKAGDKFSVAVFMKDKEGNKSELGEGRLKELLAPYAASFGEKNPKILVREKIKEINIRAKVKKVQRKPKKGEVNPEVRYDARVSDVTID